MIPASGNSYKLVLNRIQSIKSSRQDVSKKLLEIIQEQKQHQIKQSYVNSVIDLYNKKSKINPLAPEQKIITEQSEQNRIWWL